MIPSHCHGRIGVHPPDWLGLDHMPEDSFCLWRLSIDPICFVGSKA